MKGSGLEEVMGLLFGPNTVEHVLSGKAYDRAIRGHFLIHAALNDLLFDFLRNPVPNDSSHAVIAVGLDLTKYKWDSSLARFPLTIWLTSKLYMNKL